MSGPVFPSGLHNVYGEQLALTTTLASVGMPGIETKQALVYVPSTNFRMAVTPALRAAYIYDNSLSGAAKWVDKTIPLQDRASVGSGTAIDDLTVSDRVMLGFSDVTGGIRIEVTSVNAVSTTMVGNYWNGSWTSLSVTDGTDTGASLAQSGNVTWTAPTDALMAQLGVAQHVAGTTPALNAVDTGIDIGTDPGVAGTAIVMDADPSSAILAGDYIIVDSEIMFVHSSTATGNIVNVGREEFGTTAAAHTAAASVFIYNVGPAEGTESLFWVQLLWDDTLGANVEIGNIWSLVKNPTNYGFFRAGTEYALSFNRTTTGALEFDLAAGTDTADITWLRVAGG